MKLRYFLACAAAALPLVALAQSTPLNVAVQGSIKPGACTFQISEQGTFNYGKVKLKDLNKDTYTQLPIIDRELRISCESRTKVALTVSDSNPGWWRSSKTSCSSAGVARAGRPPGNMVCAMTQDAASAPGRCSWCQASRWTSRIRSPFTAATAASPGIPLSVTSSMTTAASKPGACRGRANPPSAVRFVGTVRIQVALDRSAQLGVATEVPFTGGAVMTLVYL